MKNQASNYKGVYWKKDHKKWQAQLNHKKNQYYFGGYYDNEEHAAMKVNLLCDKYGIERQNPTIIIEPNAIQQVIDLLYIPKHIKNLMVNLKSNKISAFQQAMYLFVKTRLFLLHVQFEGFKPFQNALPVKECVFLSIFFSAFWY